jgi:hypothetical protein
MLQVNEMPDEILRHIFTMGCQDHPKFRLTQKGWLDDQSDWSRYRHPQNLNRRMLKPFSCLATLVCHRWQEIVTGTSHLYLTMVQVHCSMQLPGLEDLCEQIAALAAALSDSRGSDLDIYLFIFPSCLPESRRLFFWSLTMLAKYVRQIRCVQTSCNQWDPALPRIIGLLSQSSHISTFIHLGHSPFSNFGVQGNDDLSFDLPPFDTPPGPVTHLRSIEYLELYLPVLSVMPLHVLGSVVGLAIRDAHTDWDGCLRVVAGCRTVKILSIAGVSPRWTMHEATMRGILQTHAPVQLVLLQALHIAIEASIAKPFFQCLDLPLLKHLFLLLGQPMAADGRKQQHSPDESFIFELPSLRILKVICTAFDYLHYTPVFRITAPLEKLYLEGDYHTGELNRQGTLGPRSLPAAQKVEIRGMSVYQIHLLLLRINNPAAVEVLRTIPDAFHRIRRLPKIEEKLPYQLRVLQFTFHPTAYGCPDLFSAMCDSGSFQCLELDSTDPEVFDPYNQWEEACRRSKLALGRILQPTMELPSYRSHGFHPLQGFQNVEELTLLLWYPGERGACPWTSISWLLPRYVQGSIDDRLDLPVPKMIHLRLYIGHRWPGQHQKGAYLKRHLSEIGVRLNALIDSRRQLRHPPHSIIVEATGLYGEADRRTLVMTMDAKRGVMVRAFPQSSEA